MNDLVSWIREESAAGLARLAIISVLLVLVLVYLLRGSDIVGPAGEGGGSLRRQPFSDAEPAAAVGLLAQETVRLSGFWPARIQQWAWIIERWAAQYVMDPDLIAAVIQMESGGDPEAVSGSGACGLMQVMARDTTGQYGAMFADRPTCAELKDPETNIGWAVHYLAVLYHQNGADWREALWRYGPLDRGYSYADAVLALYARSKE
jgi:soluble lytic murein transglycosylase-like protein